MTLDGAEAIEMDDAEIRILRDALPNLGRVSDLAETRSYWGRDYRISPLAEKLGLQQLGANFEVLPPGGQSSVPHAHSDEDEFVFVVSGAPQLWTDGRITSLAAGDAVAFPAGTGSAHCFLNEGAAPVELLVVSSRSEKDRLLYPAHPQVPHPRPWTDAPEHALGPHDGTARRPTGGTPTIQFYLSFRSPYAWIATERAATELAACDATLELHAIHPDPADFPNDPVAVPAKGRYLARDVARLTRTYGLTLRFPNHVDTEWSLSHAAVSVADEQGAGLRFAIEVFRQRWSEGQDVGDPAIVAEAARRAGLDGDALVDAAREPARVERTAAGWKRAAEEHGVFGVPSFVLNGELFWGQDRIPALQEALGALAPE